MCLNCITSDSVDWGHKIEYKSNCGLPSQGFLGREYSELAYVSILGLCSLPKATQAESCGIHSGELGSASLTLQQEN